MAGSEKSGNDIEFKRQRVRGPNSLKVAFASRSFANDGVPIWPTLLAFRVRHETGWSKRDKLNA
ncbi:hypothetical protein PM082_003615 [Marasmius tenuissimus]|nr:hypothetical protein PM082_003615 [Marasmius tenuissimus]